MKIGEKQNAIEDMEVEKEAKKQASDYPAEELAGWIDEGTEDIFDQDNDDITEILAMADALLYKLLDFDRNNGSKWVTDTDYDERTQLKLKEINDKGKETLLQYHIKDK